MAYGDNPQGVTELANALAVFYEMSDVAQFTRPGDTVKWFKADSKKMPGRRFVFHVYTTPISGARMSDFATARAGTFPTPMDLSHTPLSYDYEDMAMVQSSAKVNQLDLKRLDGSKDALYNLAQRIFSETAEDMSGRVNNAMHQNTSCQMATVGTKYAATGQAYSQAATCYISISGGSISQFTPGMLVTINSANYTVSDVNYESDGPHPTGGGTRVASIGPGLTLTAATGNCDTVTATNAITLSGEGASDNFLAFPSWFSGSTNVYNNEAGTAIDRDAVGNQWSIPFIETVAAAGSEVVLDLDAHLGKLCDQMAMLVNSGRRKRRDQGISIGSTLLAVGQPELVVEASREGYTSGRFTTAMAASEGDAETKELYARVGFDGAVYHHPVLGKITFQADRVAQPYKLHILEPNSWHWLEDGAGHGGLEWLDNGGDRWHRVTDPSDSNKLSFFLQAGCFTTCLPYCDQPKANALVAGVKSSV